MIKMPKFLISKGPYAIDLNSFEAKWHEFTWEGEPPPGAPKGTWYCTVHGVWFRRRRQETVACIGYLWKSFTDAPTSALEFLERHVDGRYGGNTCGRWDGQEYWGDGNLVIQQQYLEVLRPMLANYPDVPAGYDGWWRF